MQLVYPVLRFGWTFVNKFPEVDFEWELVTIVYLQVKTLSNEYGRRSIQTRP